MRTTRAALVLCSTLSLLLLGCGNGDSGDAPKTGPTSPPTDPARTTKRPADANPNAAATTGNAVLTGRVAFSGSPLPPRRVDVTKDVELCQPAAGEVPQALVSAEGGLAGVVVEIQGIDEPEGGWAWPDGEYVLTQEGCTFSPSLIVMPRGSEVTVLNEDRLTHNVNTGEWNVLQAAGDPPIVRAIDSRLPTKVSCNIHSWMEAWVYSARSPFHAVTDSEGRYEIAGVPAGSYRVAYWHPALGSERERVELTDGATLEQDITFESTVRD